MSNLGRWIVGLSVVAAVLAGGCGSDSESDSESGGASEPSEAPVRTEDGYEVILANPTKRTGPTASKQGERAQAQQRERLVLEPTSPDPEGGEFTLEEAVAEMPVDGQLVAEIGTDLGTMFCDLYADKVPSTVANFIGLARGIRPFWDPAAGDWVRRPYYRGTIFHRVVPDYLIQAGDLIGDGTGGVGYTIARESHEALRFDSAGMLAMAGTEEEPNAGQFFITDGPTPDIQGQYVIFGKCQPEDVVHRIARVPQGGRPEHRPLTPVRINRLFIQRVSGGAENARITAPLPPPGTDEPARGASKGPSQLRHEIEERRRAHQEGQGAP